MTTLNYLVGNDPAGFFFAKLILGYVGAFLLILWGATKAAKNSPTTPDRFSWSYLLSDNVKRFVANLIVIYAGVRFMAFVMPAATSEEMQLFLAFMVGLCVDAVAEKLKKWKRNFKASKD